MKKLIVVFLLSFMIGMSPIYATTSLNRKEVKNGVVSVSLHTTDTGSVTALKFRIKLEGNVRVSNFEWSPNIKSSYVRKYIEKDGFIEFYIASGTKDNLVSSDGTIEIGVFTITSNAPKEKQTYQIDWDKSNGTNIEFVNQSFTKTNPTDIITDNDMPFVLEVKANTNSNDNNSDESLPYQVKGEDEKILNVLNGNRDKDTLDQVNKLMRTDDKSVSKINETGEKESVKEATSNQFLIFAGAGICLILTGLGIVVYKKKKQS